MRSFSPDSRFCWVACSSRLVNAINHKASDPPYANGASLMWGDPFQRDITVENGNRLRIVFKNRIIDVLSADSVVLAMVQFHQLIWLREAGYYSYKIDTRRRTP